MGIVNLQDLIDGTDLDFAWGIEHVDLEGLTDTDWPIRRLAFHAECREDPPLFLRSEGTGKRKVWKRVASMEAEAKRRRHKALPRDVTRFRIRGQ